MLPAFILSLQSNASHISSEEVYIMIYEKEGGCGQCCGCMPCDCLVMGIQLSRDYQVTTMSLACDYFVISMRFIM